MADIVFRYVEMRQAAESIRTIANNYRNASASFVEDIAGIISPWEGESRDKFEAFIRGSVADYTGQTVPAVLTALADLLDANADQMEQTDRQIAENIPG